VLSDLALGDLVVSGELTGVYSAFNRTCRAENSILESTVEFTAVNATCGISDNCSCWAGCSESLCTRKSSQFVFVKSNVSGFDGEGASDWRNESISSGRKDLNARTGGELGIATSFLGFFARFGLGSLSEAVRLRDLGGCSGVGGPGAGGGGIGAANGTGVWAGIGASTERAGRSNCCVFVGTGSWYGHGNGNSRWSGGNICEKSCVWISKSVHNWSVKGGKEDCGGVCCCRIGAKRRRVGRVGEDCGGSTGEEGAGRDCCIECCSANGRRCSSEIPCCFFAGDIGTCC